MENCRLECEKRRGRKRENDMEGEEKTVRGRRRREDDHRGRQISQGQGQVPCATMFIKHKFWAIQP